MPTTMSQSDAADAVRAALRGFATDAELAALDENTPLREELQLDSIDFLTFVERLAATKQSRIEEADYPRLTSLRQCVDFLTGDS